MDQIKTAQQIEGMVLAVGPQQEQAAQASSSSNIKHLLNPYSHSKPLVHGLHLLA
jgi:hypothetical protein